MFLLLHRARHAGPIPYSLLSLLVTLDCPWDCRGAGATGGKEEHEECGPFIARSTLSFSIEEAIVDERSGIVDETNTEEYS